jgi:hypothetical protein
MYMYAYMCMHACRCHIYVYIYTCSRMLGAMNQVEGAGRSNTLCICMYIMYENYIHIYSLTHTHAHILVGSGSLYEPYHT